MNLSLNEVDAMAKKAARGAGYSWGLAEEAGKATSWLCAQGLDGVQSLADCLTHCADKSDAPLALGATLSDRAHQLQTTRIELSKSADILFLLPFAAACARQIRENISVRSGDFMAITDGRRLSLRGHPNDATNDVNVTRGGDLGETLVVCTRATPNPAAWETLNKLAHLTYAPATEESRRLGAGSDETDND